MPFAPGKYFVGVLFKIDTKNAAAATEVGFTIQAQHPNGAWGVDVTNKNTPGADKSLFFWLKTEINVNQADINANANIPCYRYEPYILAPSRLDRRGGRVPYTVSQTCTMTLLFIEDVKFANAVPAPAIPGIWLNRKDGVPPFSAIDDDELFEIIEKAK